VPIYNETVPDLSRPGFRTAATSSDPKLDTPDLVLAGGESY